MLSAILRRYRAPKIQGDRWIASSWTFAGTPQACRGRSKSLATGTVKATTLDLYLKRPIARRAEPLTDAQAATLDYLGILMPEDGRPAIPAEPKATSFGILDGRIVVVDYGDNCD